MPKRTYAVLATVTSEDDYFAGNPVSDRQLKDALTARGYTVESVEIREMPYPVVHSSYATNGGIAPPCGERNIHGLTFAGKREQINCKMCRKALKMEEVKP